MPFNILTWLGSHLTSNSNVLNWLMVAAILFNGYKLEEMGQQISYLNHKSTTEYSLNVLKFGYKNASNHAEIVELTKQWVRDNWGAQIGAIRTVCNESPNRLEELVPKDTALMLCRISR